ncbi:MAG: pyridoxamine 5'-phosphate oxidase family protein [Acidimicrobiia bacterium]|jgi:nitroimidazol reductase NimA-like FMN-containing flavoprotein (pyridoxamine 5'-phosphate oxidase superfamily)
MSDEKTRIGRRPERGVEDRSEIYSILDEGLVCHAAYVTEGRPVVIPTLYVRDRDRLLLHGSNSMGLAKAVRAGSPLSVAVTFIDGLVVARSAFNSSANYRSVVAHGTGRLLESEEKSAAFDIIVDKLIPGRLADLRPSTDVEMAQTAVIELKLDEVSAKVRAGPPGDDPADLSEDVWAGVVPLRTVAGDAVPAPDLRDGIGLPEYLDPYRR